MLPILKVAMPKGRINKPAIKLLQAAGFAIPDDLDDSR
jgi:ATP phosphoribosyltransferase